MSKHRHQRVRPRYGRIAVAASSVGVTAIAVLGGVGALPSAADQPAPAAVGVINQAAADTQDVPAARSRATAPSGTTASADGQETRTAPMADALPERSGVGRRVVFSEGEQRVWLVTGGSKVARTYPVSGSIYDNLDPGTYSVYSRSEQAWGIDDSGSMKYFVRFTQGDNAAIGFHDIPIDDGAKVQTVDQLGTPLSHGCIRQKRADAKALWVFAPLGTKVVVTP